MEPPFLVLNKDSDLGYEGVYLDNSPLGYRVHSITKGERFIPKDYLANKDGLTSDDFQEWFKRDLPIQGIIIHFTKFRYAQ